MVTGAWPIRSARGVEPDGRRIAIREQRTVGSFPHGAVTLPAPLASRCISKVLDLDFTESGLEPGTTDATEVGEIGPECARVRIRTVGGSTIERFNSEAVGAPKKPMSDVQVDNKFHELATAAGHAGRANAWLQRIRNIVNLGRCRDLWQD